MSHGIDLPRSASPLSFHNLALLPTLVFIQFPRSARGPDWYECAQILVEASYHNQLFSAFPSTASDLYLLKWINPYPIQNHVTSPRAPHRAGVPPNPYVQAAESDQVLTNSTTAWWRADQVISFAELDALGLVLSMIRPSADLPHGDREQRMIMRRLTSRGEWKG